MVDIQTISIVIASASVVAGVIYYSLQIRHQNLQMQHQTKVRQTDLIMRLYLQSCTKELMEAYLRIMNLELKDYDGFVEKYGSVYSEKPEQTAFFLVSQFYEGLGVLLHRKLVDIETVLDLFDVKSPWRKVQPIIEGCRKKLNDPYYFHWFEYLYDEMQKRQRNLQQSKV